MWVRLLDDRSKSPSSRQFISSKDRLTSYFQRAYEQSICVSPAFCLVKTGTLVSPNNANLQRIACF
jgi:hypothetical protein